MRAVLVVALVLAHGCYNPSFDGPGGFICQKGKVCPEGYQCCPRPGDDVCLPAGQCGGGTQDQGKGTDQGQGKDQGKGLDRGKKPDQSQSKKDKGGGKKDKGVVADKYTPKKDAGGTTGPCAYMEIASQDLDKTGRTFSALVDAAGNPEVFFITKAGVVNATSRKAKWKPAPIFGWHGTGLAVARETNGAVHMVVSYKQKPSDLDRYLMHMVRASSVSAFKGSKVFKETISREVDVATGPVLDLITSAQYSGSTPFWRVTTVKGSWAPFTYNNVHSMTAKNIYDMPRIASGKTRWISSVFTPTAGRSRPRTTRPH